MQQENAVNSKQAREASSEIKLSGGMTALGNSEHISVLNLSSQDLATLSAILLKLPIAVDSSQKITVGLENQTKVLVNIPFKAKWATFVAQPPFAQLLSTSVAANGLHELSFVDSDSQQTWEVKIKHLADDEAAYLKKSPLRESQTYSNRDNYRGNAGEGHAAARNKSAE